MNLTLSPHRILVEPVEQADPSKVEVVDALGSDQKARGRVVLTRYNTSDIEIGDIVHFIKGSGEELEFEGKKYRVLWAQGSSRESEVLAVEISEENHMKRIRGGSIGTLTAPIDAFRAAAGNDPSTTPLQ